MVSGQVLAVGKLFQETIWVPLWREPESFVVELSGRLCFPGIHHEQREDRVILGEMRVSPSDGVTAPGCFP